MLRPGQAYACRCEHARAVGVESAVAKQEPHLAPPSNVAEMHYMNMKRTTVLTTCRCGLQYFEELYCSETVFPTRLLGSCISAGVVIHLKPGEERFGYDLNDDRSRCERKRVICPPHTRTLPP